MKSWFCYKSCEDKKWFIFLGIDCLIYGVVYFILLVKIKYNKYLLSKIYATVNRRFQSHSNLDIYQFSRYSQGPFSFLSRFLVDYELFQSKLNLFNICMNMISFVIFAVNGYSNPIVENCCLWTENVFEIVQIALMFYFCVCFGLEFITQRNLMDYWRNIYTIIDIFTIPNVFTGIILQRTWSGFLFLRFFWIYKVPDAIQRIGLMDVRNIIRLWHLASIFLSIWVGGAGLFFLIENTGDIWMKYENHQNISYGKSFYFTLVTMATIGYGDVVANTECGRIFICIFILISMGIFVSFIPEISDILMSHSIYNKSYKPVVNRKHVVVSGSMHDESIEKFLEDFYHDNRNSKNISVGFISRKKPSLYLKILLNRYSLAQYFEGTAMRIYDLIRVRADIADACLVVTKRYCEDEDEVDAANIMRVISVKAFTPDQRVVVQLQRFHNKMHLLNIPSWCPLIGDEVICFNELKLGILARSCLCKGFSTIVCNIFTIYSLNKNIDSLNKPWIKLYSRGFSMAIFRGTLSQFYYLKSFKDVANHCFINFSLIIFGLEIVSDDGDCIIVLNPSSHNLINQNCIAYFLTNNPDMVFNASIFCEKCHSNKPKEKKLKKCKCSKYLPLNLSFNFVVPRRSMDVNDREMEKVLDKSLHNQYHIIPSRSFQDCLVTTNETFTGHFVLCIFSKDHSKAVGLINFIKPLRIKNDVHKKIEAIVIIGNEIYLQKEWKSISQFPEIYVVIGSCFDKDVLNIAQVQTSSTCVLINAPSSVNENSSDPYLVDKEVILGTLNIENYLRVVNNKDGRFGEYNLIKTKIVADINIENNIRFLYPTDFDNPIDGAYFTQAFASGHAYCNNILYSLLSSTYFDCNTINLLRLFIEGSRDESFEKISGIIRMSHIKLLALKEDRFKNLCGCQTFGEIYLKALRHNDTVMFGIYRLYKSIRHIEYEDASIRRIVLLFPPSEFLLDESDFFYGLTSNI